MRFKTAQRLIILFACLGSAAQAAPTEVVASPEAALPAPAPAADQGGVEQLMSAGLQYLGIRYRFGGTTPESGFDCSGLVRRVFSDALGLDLPRTAKEIAQRGEQVKRSELKPGDLVFFKTMRQTFSHVGIYLGDNQFLHSPSAGGKVRVESMDSDYWRARFKGARRLLEGDNAPSAMSANETSVR
ncbi:C40 family peptidase [Niveibacterium sp. SC-1]|uniref:C40 family peptidase n=1 Tax=Niveibacterium sp. SC-1 TaxID=3135646 RepID=UPI00311ED2C2